jgi:hypothetical protein
MKRNHAGNGFWEPGLSNYCDELAKEQESRLAPLKMELKKTSDAARKARLKEEIAAIKAEYRQKRKNAGYGLFFRN